MSQTILLSCFRLHVRSRAFLCADAPAWEPFWLAANRPRFDTRGARPTTQRSHVAAQAIPARAILAANALRSYCSPFAHHEDRR
jgi:hypothetical protein